MKTLVVLVLCAGIFATVHGGTNQERSSLAKLFSLLSGEEMAENQLLSDLENDEIAKLQRYCTMVCFIPSSCPCSPRLINLLSEVEMAKNQQRPLNANREKATVEGTPRGQDQSSLAKLVSLLSREEMVKAEMVNALEHLQVLAHKENEVAKSQRCVCFRYPCPCAGLG